MESLLSQLDFIKANQQTYSDLVVKLDKLQKNGGIEANEISKCLQIFQAKVAVRDFPSQTEQGYYCAFQCFKMILAAIE